MARFNIGIGIVLLVLSLLLLAMVEASGLLVDETVKGFRISFDAIDDTNMVAKFWYNGSAFLGSSLKPPTNELVDGVVVVAGNASDPYKRWAMCLVFAFKNPENTSNMEKNLTKNSTNNYVRVFDRVVDGHEGLLLSSGNGPSDPLLNYTAAYWLDEVNGNATKCVVIVSQWPWDKGTERLLNTIHVEEAQQVP